MAEITCTRDIAAEPGAVWAVLADFGAISGWASNVEHSCLMSEQAEGVGTVRRVQVGRSSLVERVVDWAPGVTLSYSIEGLPPVIRSVANTWSLRETTRGTRVSLTSRVNAGPRPPQQLIAEIVARRLAKASETMLAGLDRHMAKTAGADR
ncbi:SRPBCC family protein [Candidatus Poriferisocius sp.]|uniref:SRPBCC family protein n=1 Tax=Candidatus Poriferisocius sp. TaxID=3101276 RepID=UPI003B013114